MSTTNNETKPTNQQGPDAPQASENKPEVAKLPATSEGEKPEKMDVDSTEDATKSKPDVATGTESKPDTNDGADAKVTSTEKKNERLRFNGSGRKRYKWLIDHGYDREEAIILANDPIKVKELREKSEGKKKFNFEEERKALGVTAKKRLNWLLKNGYTEQEAIALARKPLSLKRTNGNPAGGPPNKVAKPTTITGPIVMAVAAKDYPSTFLKRDQANKLKAAILQQVVERKIPELKPQFSNCTFIKGYLRVECSDQVTREWLQKILPKLELWEGASLKVMAEKNLLKFDKFVAYFPESRTDSDKDILSFIECQNENVDTSKWVIHGRKEAGKKVELTFSMDAASTKLLEKMDNEVNYKFNKVSFSKIKPVATAPTRTTNNQIPPNNQVGLPNRGPLPNDRLTSLLSSLVPIWDIALPKVTNIPQVVNPVERSSNVFLDAINSAGRMNNEQQRNNNRGNNGPSQGITPAGRANISQQRNNRRGNADILRSSNSAGRANNDQQRNNQRGNMFDREQRSGGRNQSNYNNNSRSLMEELCNQQGNNFGNNLSSGRNQMNNNSGSRGDNFYNRQDNNDGLDMFNRNRSGGNSSNRNNGNNQNDNAPRKRSDNRNSYGSSGGNQSNSLFDNLYDQLRNTKISSGNNNDADQLYLRRGNNYSSGDGNFNNYNSSGGNRGNFNDNDLQRSSNFSTSSGFGGNTGFGSFSSSYNQLSRNTSTGSYSSSYGRLSLGRRSFFGF